MTKVISLDQIIGQFVAQIQGPHGAHWVSGGGVRGVEADISVEKKCPQCAETIKAEALVCRYCGHRFLATP